MKLLKAATAALPLAPKQNRIGKTVGFLVCSITSCLMMVPSGLLAQSVRLPVNLGTAGDYVVLSKAGITDVPPSPIVGNIGASPITGAAIHVTCSEVTGTISSVDAAGPACSQIVPIPLGTAIDDMNTAFTDAAGRTTPDHTELGAGDITGMTLVPGLYKWSTDLLVSAAGVTLSGGPNAVWIFQIAGDLTLANGAHIILAGGASPNNIFWQVGASNYGAVLGTGSVMYGTILSAAQVIENTGATLVGRALARTQVTLQSTSVTSPGPLVGGIPAQQVPSVTSTVPSDHAGSVPTNSKLSATFSEPMDPATIINPTTFTLLNGLAPVSGSVGYSGVTAIFTPTNPLPAGTLLKATITTGAKDPAGVALAANYVWTFTTGSGPVLIPPTVSSTVPANNATNIPVGNSLAATFSEAMDPTTITAASFSLKQGGTPVPGAVTYSGLTAIFIPTGSLPATTLLTATIASGVKDLLGNAMVSNYVWSFTTNSSASTILPTVSSTFPASTATNVPVNVAVSATFSEPMNPLTITTVNFRLQTGSTVIPGTVSYAGLTAVFKPTANLVASTAYTAVVTSAAADLAGNFLATNYFWSFTTGAAPNLTPPTVSSTVPAAGATLVPVGSALAAIFSEAMDPATITTATFSLQQGGIQIAGTVSYSGVTAVFTPATNLLFNGSFTATITSGVKDLAGNAMVSNYTWSFATGATLSNLPPTVISTAPANNATAVTTSTNVVANFSESMNPLTISTATFLLLKGTTPIPGAVTYAGVSATFRPLTNLAPATLYTAQIAGSVADLSGSLLGATYTWTFTTGASGNQAPVCLGNFAALAGTAITSTGPTIVTGDLGVTPGTAVTGFPPGTINGTTYTGNNANVAQAMRDVTAAFADAAGRSVGLISVTGDLGGQTFTSGLYKSTSSLQIASGNLTLDAKGDVNAVFIFQMASTLTTASGNSIILAGGAQAFNVFWQVGTSATLGANSVFAGSILAGQSITVNTGANVSGRLAALTGSVTLQSDVLTSPPPFIALNAIFNLASYANTVAAGSIASVFGNNFGSSTISASAYPLLPSLAQTSFQVGSQAGPLFMTSCSQTNLQIPWESAGQTQVPVIATVAGLSSPAQTATVAQFSPGIFTTNQLGSGQGMVEVASSGLLAAPLAPGASPVARGQYVAIYCTGLGAVTNQPATGAAASSSPLSYTTTLPTVTIGGAPAVVTYSGLAPGFAGLYQVNALVPTGITPGSAVPLVINIQTSQSNTVTIAVQ